MAVDYPRFEHLSKEGNKEEFKVNGGIGLVTSRLLAEGPLGDGSL